MKLLLNQQISQDIVQFSIGPVMNNNTSYCTCTYRKRWEFHQRVLKRLGVSINSNSAIRGMNRPQSTQRLFFAIEEMIWFGVRIPAFDHGSNGQSPRIRELAVVGNLASTESSFPVGQVTRLGEGRLQEQLEKWREVNDDFVGIHDRIMED